MSGVRYRHRQTGTTVMLSLLAGAAIVTSAAVASGNYSSLTIILALLLLTGVLFASLTTEVGADELNWYFGPGFWKKRVPLADIPDTQVVRRHS